MSKPITISREQAMLALSNARSVRIELCFLMAKANHEMTNITLQEQYDKQSKLIDYLEGELK